MVDQPDDRLDAEPLQRDQPLVRPAPVSRSEPGRRDALPQHRLAQRADAERCKTIEVIVAHRMAITIQLAEIAIVHAIDRAFDAAPQREAVSHPASPSSAPLRSRTSVCNSCRIASAVASHEVVASFARMRRIMR